VAIESTRDPTLGITLLPTLTAKQQQVLEVIHRLVIERQAYPTQREVAMVLGFTQATTGQHFEALLKKGYLLKATGEVRRNYRLTPLALERLKSQDTQAPLPL
jgi:DNA-binding MarR family transcriptional regulator